MKRRSAHLPRRHARRRQAPQRVRAIDGIIRKGKTGKPNEFGKMVKLQEAEDQIVIDYEV
jgi:hypothetical protein